MVKIKNNKVFASKMDQYKNMYCPRCSTLISKKVMRKIKHPSNAILDVCDKCNGMWLDGNEVKILYNFSKKIKSKRWKK